MEPWATNGGKTDRLARFIGKANELRTGNECVIVGSLEPAVSDQKWRKRIARVCVCVCMPTCHVQCSVAMRVLYRTSFRR
jgi:hypothetical protein